MRASKSAGLSLIATLLLTSTSVVVAQQPMPRAGEKPAKVEPASQPVGTEVELEPRRWASFFHSDNPTYFQADALYWEASDPAHRGPLLITGSSRDASPFFNGGLSFDSGKFNTDHQPGFRLLLGRNIDGDITSLEIGGHWVHPNYESATRTAQVTQVLDNQVPVLQIDSVTFGPTGAALTTGSVRLEIRNFGIESNLRTLLYNGPRVQVDGLAGFRWVEYQEKFDSRLVLQANGQTIAERSTVNNAMVGGQIGTDSRLKLCDYVSLQGICKFGFTANFASGDLSRLEGATGQLTGPSNTGGFDQTDFAFVTDLFIGLVFDLTPNVHVHTGYSGLYMSDVQRAISQLDLSPAVAGDPQPRHDSESVWLHGFTAALEINY